MFTSSSPMRTRSRLSLEATSLKQLAWLESDLAWANNFIASAKPCPQVKLASQKTLYILIDLLRWSNRSEKYLIVFNLLWIVRWSSHASSWLITSIRRSGIWLWSGMAWNWSCFRKLPRIGWWGLADKRCSKNSRSLTHLSLINFGLQRSHNATNSAFVV